MAGGAPGHRPLHRRGLVLRHGRALCLHPRAPGADRGGDAQNLQGKAEAGAVRAAPGRGAGVHGGEGRALQGGAHQRSPRGRGHLPLQAGGVHRPVRRPPPGLHRAHQGQCPEAHRLQRRLLAWGLQPGDPPAHLWHRLPQEGRAGRLPPAH